MYHIVVFRLKLLALKLFSLNIEYCIIYENKYSKTKKAFHAKRGIESY